MKRVTKKQFIYSTVWKIIEKFSGRGISLVISIILARILSPNDYGLIALTTVFTNFSDILIDGGFSTALIRKKDVDELDYSCVFIISISIATILYLLLFLCTPFIVAYYNEPQLKPVLLIMGLVFFIQAFSSTRNAKINRQMQFRSLMICSVASGIISGVIGIVIALSGGGVWALVAQRLSQQLLLTIFLLIKIKWKIKWKIDFARIKQLLKFSTGVIGSSFLSYLGSSFYSAVIGKKYSVVDLGFYDKGILLPEQISMNSFGAMTNVLLPTLASHQDNKRKFNSIIRRVVKCIALLIMPAMLGLAVISKELIILLFSSKWLSSLRVMQLFCIYYIFTPLMLIDVQVFFALGKSQIRMKLESIRLLLLSVGMLVGIFIFNVNMEQLVAINVGVSFITTLISSNEVKKLIGYGIIDKLKDMSWSILNSIIMIVVIIIMDKMVLIGLNSIVLKLLLKLVVGILVYSILTLIFNKKVIKEIKR